MRENASMASTPINARGAVDLGALATQRQQQTKAAAAMAAAPPGIVVDVTEATFETEVIERSMTVPVLIDLWAEWCGPCKQLSPVLETVVASYGGRLVLAKIDVDANPRISAAFQVQSIPSVFVALKGQIAPLFQAAIPEAQVRQVIEQVMAAAAQQGISGSIVEGDDAAPPVEPPMDPRFEAAYQAIEAGDWAGAEQVYRRLLDEAPSDPDAQAGLALVTLYRRAMDADPATVLAAATSSADVPAQLAAADVEALSGAWSAAFNRLIAVVQATTGDDRERARTRLLELFIVAGDDPAVPRARLALANALF